MMNEHNTVRHRCPNTKINATFPCRTDDQQLVPVFAAQEPRVLRDPVMELWSSEAGKYALRDTPRRYVPRTAVANFAIPTARPSDRLSDEPAVPGGG